MQIHSNTVQITDFILWAVPKHLPSKSFVHSVLYFLFVGWLLIHLLSQPCTFPSLREVPVCRYEGACLYPSFLLQCESLYPVVDSWHLVTYLLIDVSKSWEMLAQPLRPSASFSSSVVCFKGRNQFLVLMIITGQLDKTINNITNWKKC